MECQELLELLLAAARRVDEAIKPLACQYAAVPDPSQQAANAADALAESAALNVLLSADVRVLSEEAGWLGQGSALVVLDPIDGTDNLTRGDPVLGPFDLGQNQARGLRGSGYQRIHGAHILGYLRIRCLSRRPASKRSEVSRPRRHDRGWRVPAPPWPVWTRSRRYCALVVCSS